MNFDVRLVMLISN